MELGWGRELGPLMQFFRDLSTKQSFFHLFQQLPVGFSSSFCLWLAVSSLPSPDNHGNQMPPLGVVDTEVAFSLVSHSAPSPLYNYKTQRRNSIFKLLHHQIGHICEVTVFFFYLNSHTSSLKASFFFSNLRGNTVGAFILKSGFIGFNWYYISVILFLALFHFYETL